MKHIGCRVTGGYPVNRREPDLCRRQNDRAKRLACLFLGLAVIMALPVSGNLVCDESVYDFGDSDESAVLNHTFTIRNDGGTPVHIKRVQSTCGCTTTGVNKESLEPGETTELTARIVLRGRSGRQRYSLNIITDNPAQPVFNLVIKGNVVMDMMIDPQRLSFHWPAPESALSSQVRLVSGGATEFAITDVKVSDPAIMAETQIVRAGLEYAVTVSIEKELMRPPFRGWVMIHTDHPRYPKFQIPVSIASGGGVVVRPTALTLAAQPDNVPQRRMLIVYSRTSTPFVIETLTLPDGATSTVNTASPHRHDIHLDGLFPLAAQQRQTVTITTSLGESIEVPIRLMQTLQNN